ncbi:hypothetical protein ACFQ07_29525, partial [Actinomadura adrarensis]
VDGERVTPEQPKPSEAPPETEPAKPGESAADRTDHGEDPSAPEIEQPDRTGTAEAAETPEGNEDPERPTEDRFIGDKLPDSVAGLRPDERGLLRQRDVHPVRPGEVQPEATSEDPPDRDRPDLNHPDLNRPSDIYDRMQDHGRHVEPEQSVQEDIREPDQDTTGRRRRMGHKLALTAGDTSDMGKKSGNKLGDYFHPNPNKDLYKVSTVIDTRPMRDADYKPMKYGDAVVGASVLGFTVAYGAIAAYRWVKAKWRSRDARE